MSLTQGKSSTLCHVWHVCFTHILTQTNTLSPFSWAILGLTWSVQCIFGINFPPNLWKTETLTPGALQPSEDKHTCLQPWMWMIPLELMFPSTPRISQWKKPCTFTSTNVISTYCCTCDALRTHQKLKEKRHKNQINHTNNPSPIPACCQNCWKLCHNAFSSCLRV